MQSLQKKNFVVNYEFATAKCETFQKVENKVKNTKNVLVLLLPYKREIKDKVKV